MPSFQALFLVLTWVRQARAFLSEFKELSIDFGQGQMVQRICEAAEKAKVELLITQTEITGKTTTAVTSTPSNSKHPLTRHPQSTTDKVKNSVPVYHPFHSIPSPCSHTQTLPTTPKIHHHHDDKAPTIVNDNNDLQASTDRLSPNVDNQPATS